MSIINNNALGMVSKLTINHKEDWISFVERAAEFDFYHTWHYHSLVENDIPLLFVYADGNDFIAIPLLKREIPNTNYYDLHSVYGYSGPISNIRFNEIPEYLIENFKRAFLDFVKDEEIVSVFSKLHPFINHHKILERFGGVYENGKTVAIDLRDTIENQRKKYRQSTKEAVNRCTKLGFKLKESTGEEDIAAFANLYKQNMGRIKASEFYLFTEEYFKRLLNTTEYVSKLLLIVDGDEIACGSIITFNNGIMQGHLIATNAKYLRNSPAKFLLHQASILGRTLGMSFYHLGGGLGFKENSLLDWKLGFSDFVLDYKSWRFIANEPVYNELVIKSGNSIDNPVDFFPLYRMIHQ